jgi:hypothetical protein
MDSPSDNPKKEKLNEIPLYLIVPDAGSSVISVVLITVAFVAYMIYVGTIAAYNSSYMPSFYMFWSFLTNTSGNDTYLKQFETSIRNIILNNTGLCPTDTGPTSVPVTTTVPANPVIQGSKLVQNISGTATPGPPSKNIWNLPTDPALDYGHQGQDILAGIGSVPHGGDYLADTFVAKRAPESFTNEEPAKTDQLHPLANSIYESGAKFWNKMMLSTFVQGKTVQVRRA